MDVPGVEVRPGIATDTDILRAHICVPNVNRVITQSHRIAAGGNMLAADLVLSEKVDRTFAWFARPVTMP